MTQNKYLRYLTLLTFTICFFSCKRDPITRSSLCGGIPASTHPKAAAYQAIVNKYIRQGLPGISVSLFDNQGQWTSASGKADIARNIAMEPCHLGKIASITKTLVATVAMKLVEEGKISLNDPLTKWLPTDITDRMANAKSITLLYLLTHQTGLQDFDGDQRFYLDAINNPNKTWTQKEVIKYGYDKPALFSPGTCASYSNINTVLAATMLESATGKSHAALIREKILEPLLMNDTYYQGHDALPAGKVAQGYFDLFKENVLVNVSDYNFGYGTGAGGLVSNVYNMQTFIRALFVQKTLVSQQSLDLMTQWYKGSDRDWEIGIGLLKEGISFGPDIFSYGHSGGDLGFTSDLDWVPQKNVSIAMFANVGVGRGGSFGSVYRDFRLELINEILK